MTAAAQGLPLTRIWPIGQALGQDLLREACCGFGQYFPVRKSPVPARQTRTGAFDRNLSPLIRAKVQRKEPTGGNSVGRSRLRRQRDETGAANSREDLQTSHRQGSNCALIFKERVAA